mmetsp:Transcript_9548/g.25496  ORF Transcript_9548/g.25496 Transcript_9548/m.25496 type:complete len:220 (-) Transcript_9548:71-730(-)
MSSQLEFEFVITVDYENTCASHQALRIALSSRRVLLHFGTQSRARLRKHQHRSTLRPEPRLSVDFRRLASQRHAVWQRNRVLVVSQRAAVVEVEVERRVASDDYRRVEAHALDRARRVRRVQHHLGVRKRHVVLDFERRGHTTRRLDPGLPIPLRVHRRDLGALCGAKKCRPSRVSHIAIHQFLRSNATRRFSGVHSCETGLLKRRRAALYLNSSQRAY